MINGKSLALIIFSITANGRKPYVMLGSIYFITADSKLRNKLEFVFIGDHFDVLATWQPDIHQQVHVYSWIKL